MTATDPTADDSKGVTDEYQSALAFYSGDEPEETYDTPRAKTILWLDQTKPLFVCSDCNESLRGMEWSGDETREDYDGFRAEMYETLLNSDPECDVCVADGVADSLEEIL